MIYICPGAIAVLSTALFGSNELAIRQVLLEVRLYALSINYSE